MALQKEQSALWELIDPLELEFDRLDPDYPAEMKWNPASWIPGGYQNTVNRVCKMISLYSEESIAAARGVFCKRRSAPHRRRSDAKTRGGVR